MCFSSKLYNGFFKYFIFKYNFTNFVGIKQHILIMLEVNKYYNCWTKKCYIKLNNFKKTILRLVLLYVDL